MREKAIEKLKEYGYNAIDEGGILMILYDGPEKAFDKVFKNGCAIAKAAGYRSSIGMRQVKKEGNNDVKD